MPLKCQSLVAWKGEPVEVEGPALVEGEAVLLEDPVRTNLFEERLKKPDVPLVLHPAAVDAVVHQILKRMTADRHFYSTSKRCNESTRIVPVTVAAHNSNPGDQGTMDRAAVSKQAGLVRI